LSRGSWTAPRRDRAGSHEIAETHPARRPPAREIAPALPSAAGSRWPTRVIEHRRRGTPAPCRTEHEVVKRLVERETPPMPEKLLSGKPASTETSSPETAEESPAPRPPIGTSLRRALRTPASPVDERSEVKVLTTQSRPPRLERRPRASTTRCRWWTAELGPYRYVRDFLHDFRDDRHELLVLRRSIQSGRSSADTTGSARARRIPALTCVASICQCLSSVRAGSAMIDATRRPGRLLDTAEARHPHSSVLSEISSQFQDDGARRRTLLHRQRAESASA